MRTVDKSMCICVCLSDATRQCSIISTHTVAMSVAVAAGRGQVTSIWTVDCDVMNPHGRGHSNIYLYLSPSIIMIYSWKETNLSDATRQCSIMHHNTTQHITIIQLDRNITL